MVSIIYLTVDNFFLVGVINVYVSYFISYLGSDGQDPPSLKHNSLTVGPTILTNT